MKLKKILVPIDYSECSINALRYAGQLAKQFDSSILILHALNKGTVAKPEHIQTQKSEHIDKISSITDEEPTLSSIMTDILVSEKAPLKAIFETYDLFNIDLIVMGTKGVHKPFDILTGSFAYHVVSESHVPVLVIPGDSQYRPIKTIGFGVDYKSIDHTDNLDIIKDISYSFSSSIDIFHVVKYGSKHELLEKYEASKLDDYFDGIEHEFETIESRSVEEGIKKFVKTSQPDLLVIMPRRYNFFKWLKHDSITEEIVQHFHIPILTIPEK